MSTIKTDCMQDSLESAKQIVQLIEKKKRNLEKKKNRLDDLKTRQRKGEVLNEDQLKSLERYDGLIQSLECIKELIDGTNQMVLDLEKQAKKVAKKEKAVREKSVESSIDGDREKENSVVPNGKDVYEELEKRLAEQHKKDLTDTVMNKMKLYFQIQEVLTDLGQDEIRCCFQEGVNGAIILSEEELDYLDNFYPLVNPTREGITAKEYNDLIDSSAKHLTFLFEARATKITELDSTYSVIADLFHRIINSEYYLHNRHSVTLSSNTPVLNGEDAVAEEKPQAPFGDGSYEPISSNFTDYSSKAISTENHEPVKTLTKVIEPLQSSFNFLQMSEVDSRIETGVTPPAFMHQSQPSTFYNPPPPTAPPMHQAPRQIYQPVELVQRIIVDPIIDAHPIPSSGNTDWAVSSPPAPTPVAVKEQITAPEPVHTQPPVNNSWAARVKVNAPASTPVAKPMMAPPGYQPQEKHHQHAFGIAAHDNNSSTFQGQKPMQQQSFGISDWSQEPVDNDHQNMHFSGRQEEADGWSQSKSRGGRRGGPSSGPPRGAPVGSGFRGNRNEGNPYTNGFNQGRGGGGFNRGGGVRDIPSGRAAFATGRGGSGGRQF